MGVPIYIDSWIRERLHVQQRRSELKPESLQSADLTDFETLSETHDSWSQKLFG